MFLVPKTYFTISRFWLRNFTFLGAEKFGELCQGTILRLTEYLGHLLLGVALGILTSQVYRNGWKHGI